jgi:hypothetical protein
MAQRRNHCQIFNRLSSNFKLSGHGKIDGCLLAPIFLSLVGRIMLHATFTILLLTHLTSPGDFVFALRILCILIAFIRTDGFVLAIKANPASVKLVLSGFTPLLEDALSPGVTAVLAPALSLLQFPCWALRETVPPDLLDTTAPRSRPRRWLG